MEKEKFAVCIGGANIDLQGFSAAPVHVRDSNPGRLEISPGGVGRNIAENLARMGLPVKMIMVTGNDPFGSMIRKSCLDAGMDISESEIISGCRSSAYLSITDFDGDMYVAVSDMHIIKQMGIEFVQRHTGTIQQASVIITEPNLSSESLGYLSETYHQIPIFVDVISTTYARTAKDFMKNFYLIKGNQYEAEVLADMPINSEKDLCKAVDKILNSGVFAVVVSMGKNGVYYKNQSGLSGFSRSVREVKVINATGAGDAMTAGLVYSFLKKYDLSHTLNFSTAASIMALEHQNTINPAISAASIEKMLANGDVEFSEKDFNDK